MKHCPMVKNLELNDAEMDDIVPNGKRYIQDLMDLGMNVEVDTQVKYLTLRHVY